MRFILWLFLIGIVLLSVTVSIVALCVYTFMASPFAGIFVILFWIVVSTVVSAFFWR